jgi:signal transduction histidine kinase
MKMLAILRCGFVFSLLASIALGIVTIRKMSETRLWTSGASNAIKDYILADRTLQLDLLSARAGLLRNYDSVNADIISERKSIADLQKLVMRPKARDLLAGLIVNGDRQELLVERFKSNNALMQNSLARFAAAETARANTGTILSARIFKLTLDTSPQTVAEARASLRNMPQPPAGTPAAQLVSHARLLVSILPEIDGLLSSICKMHMEDRIDAMRLELTQEANDYLIDIRRLQIALILAIFLFIATATALMLKQGLRTRDFMAQAENERLIAAIAMPLIETGATNPVSCIQNAIGRLALHVGAKQLQLFIPENPNAIQFSWPDAKPNSHWLQDLAEAAEADGAWANNRVIVSRNDSKIQPTLNRAMCDAGIKDLVMLRAAEPLQVVIGIEPKGLACAQRSDHLAAIASAIVAIAHGARREAMQVERQRLERTLARARRMELIGAMASGVAHNFNNIIAAIGGFAETGQEHTKNGSAARYHFDEIRAAVDRSRDLVDDILNFAKLGRSTKQPINVFAVVTQTVHLLSASAREGGDFRLFAPERLYTVIGAGSDLQQVFLNIANNASHASGGRPVDISIQRLELAEARQMSHGRLSPQTYVVIFIRDTGLGILESVRLRLFEPFFTTKAGGTGLGLSTAWEIVRDHGGTIDVTNMPEGGAQFAIWLPEAAANVGVPVVGDGARILLLAEPERLSAEEELLAEIGFEPLGFALSTDLHTIRNVIGDCDAVFVAASQVRVAEDVADQIGVVLGARPLFLATPNGEGRSHTRSALTLSYPLRSNEVSKLLIETLAARVPAAA